MVQYGSQVTPNEPTQNMALIDTIVGSVHTRDNDQAQFTGGAGSGNSDTGLGGQAIGTEPQTVPVGGY